MNEAPWGIRDPEVRSHSPMEGADGPADAVTVSHPCCSTPSEGMQRDINTGAIDDAEYRRLGGARMFGSMQA